MDILLTTFTSLTAFLKTFSSLSTVATGPNVINLQPIKYVDRSAVLLQPPFL